MEIESTDCQKYLSDTISEIDVNGSRKQSLLIFNLQNKGIRRFTWWEIWSSLCVELLPWNKNRSISLVSQWLEESPRQNHLSSDSKIGRGNEVHTLFLSLSLNFFLSQSNSVRKNSIFPFHPHAINSKRAQLLWQADEGQLLSMRLEHWRKCRKFPYLVQKESGMKYEREREKKENNSYSPRLFQHHGCCLFHEDRSILSEDLTEVLLASVTLGHVVEIFLFESITIDGFPLTKCPKKELLRTVLNTYHHILSLNDKQNIELSRKSLGRS